MPILGSAKSTISGNGGRGDKTDTKKGNRAGAPCSRPVGVTSTMKIVSHVPLAHLLSVVIKVRGYSYF